jgi:hypothetical protein
MAEGAEGVSTSVSIRTEWHAAEGIAAPELAATFCRLELWLGDHCLTRVEDKRGGGVRDGIYCAAYSLAEWLATHWWSLRQDVRYADRSAHQFNAALNGEGLPINDRHDLRGANDGFIWPVCTIAPEGEQTLISWRSRPSSPSEPIVYLSSGAAYIDTDVLSRSFAGFIDAVIERLSVRGVRAGTLTDEWQAIARADDEEAAFCNAAAALGLDPYDLDPRIARLLERLGAALGDSVTLELAQAADPALLADDFKWLVDAEAYLKDRPLCAAKLTPLRAAVPDASRFRDAPPYRVGWEHARAARQVLSWDPCERADIEGLVDVDRRPGNDAALLGAAMVRTDNLALRVGARGETTGRFVAGRALWRGIHSDSNKPFLITNATTWSHKVERAFAAELLAPVAGIEEIIGRPRVVDLETMYDLAQRYAVAPTLIRHQLENQLDAVVAF